jgi:hypothetical protein
LNATCSCLLFWVTRPRAPRLGLKVVPHDPTGRRIRKFKSMLLGKPPLGPFVAPKALRLGEPLFELFHHASGNGLLVRIGTWLSDLVGPFEASVFVEFEPAGNCVAMDPRDGGPLRFGSLPRRSSAEAACDSGAGSGR